MNYEIKKALSDDASDWVWIWTFCIDVEGHSVQVSGHGSFETRDAALENAEIVYEAICEGTDR